MSEASAFKVKSVSGASAFRKYRDVTYGDLPLGRVILAEIIITLFGGLGGALGLALRQMFYPFLFPTIGKKVVFGRNVTIRHPHKIRIGDGVILDDNALIDAKGSDNRGITLGSGVYVGRNTLIYCKNGNITIGDRVNLSSNCQLASTHDITIGPDSVIAAYTYFISGGSYDYAPNAPRFAAQDGFITKGPLIVGPNCWIGAGVVVLDGVCIGEHCVIAAGAVVNRSVPDHSLAGGIPARVLKSIAP